MQTTKRKSRVARPPERERKQQGRWYRSSWTRPIRNANRKPRRMHYVTW